MPFASARADEGGIAIVDWALLETALALGLKPMAAVELVLYQKIVAEPALPDGIIDLGLRGALNFELLATLQPSLIYGSNYSAWANDTLMRMAPVREFSIYLRGQAPFEKAVAAMRGMAGDQGLQARAETYISETEHFLAATGERLARQRQRPILIINLGDARHFRAFGSDSMFGDVAARMGFVNSWATRTAYSAAAPVGLESLADHPDAIIAVVGPVPPEAARTLPQSALWRAMPAVREGRTVWLPNINPFGGLPAARRFARLLAEELKRVA
nr:ABC transporter substrate-binding protein [Tianweitania aestuarii]